MESEIKREKRNEQKVHRKNWNTYTHIYIKQYWTTIITESPSWHVRTDNSRTINVIFYATRVAFSISLNAIKVILVRRVPFMIWLISGSRKRIYEPFRRHINLNNNNINVRCLFIHVSNIINHETHYAHSALVCTHKQHC